MATVKKDNLPKGISWRADRNCYIGRVTYQGKSHTLYDKNCKRLNIRLQELRVELERGSYIKESNSTLDSWFETWMEDYKRRSLKINTYNNYWRYYNFYIKKEFGKKKLKDISADDIQSLYNRLKDRDYATSTVKAIATILNSCFKKAVQKRMLTYSPVALAEIPRCKEKEERYVLTKEAQVQFMECLEESCLSEFLECVIMTGMRNGEARALRWQDIDFSKKQIHINHTLIGDRQDEFKLDTPKTKTSKRVIPMLSQVYETLLNLKEQADASNIGGVDNFVFCLPDGLPLSRFRVENELGRIENKLKQSEVIEGHLTCHSLRHTFATRAIESGMKPQVLKTILGHSSLAMTMDLYAHVLGDEKEQEMNLLENIF